MTHLSEFDFALYAGGDLGWTRRVRLGLHLRQCENCRIGYARYREIRTTLRNAADDLPPNIDWDRLSSEITANIRLGLAAGACVATPSKPSHLTGWRPAAVLASACLIVLCAWLLTQQAPAPVHVVEAPAPVAEGITLEVTAAGVGLRDQGRVLTLLNPEKDVAYSVSLEGSVRARYVDSETGQVTINHVYSE